MVWPFKREPEPEPEPLFSPQLGWRVTPGDPEHQDAYWRQTGGWGSRTEDEAEAHIEALQRRPARIRRLI